MVAWRIVTLALAACLSFLLHVQDVRAHAVLLETSPGADAVAAAPERVTLTFNEPVRIVFARILDASGKEIVPARPARSVDHRVEIDLPSGIADGGYIVSWRVISEDSHPIGGSFRFAVGAFPENWLADAPTDTSGWWDWLWRSATVLSRTVFLMALLSAAGGICFLVAFRAHVRMDGEGQDYRRAAAFAFLSALAAAAYIPVQGGLILGVAPGDALNLDLWRTGVRSSLGASALISGSAMAAAGIGLLSGMFLSGGRKRLPAVLLVIAAAAVGALAFAGHAATASPRTVTAPAVAIHAGLAAAWLGALWPLLAAAGRLPAQELAALLARFSRMAVAAVAVLLAAGVVIAWVQVESLPALVETDYGRFLLIKLGFVALVLLAAVENKRRLTPALARGDEGARGRLARNIRLEIAGLSAAILVTAALGQNTPPRALADMHALHQGGHVHGHVHDISRAVGPGKIVTEATDHAGRRAVIEIAPGQPGNNVVRVRFFQRNGSPLIPLETRIETALPEFGIEPLGRLMEQDGEIARLSGSDLILSGTWSMRIDALVTDFDKAIFETSVTLR